MVLLVASAAFVAASHEPGRADTPRVTVVPIEGMIDLGMGPFVERALRQAAERRDAAVILDVNTFGGRVDAAVAIRDHLLESPVPTVAFVDPRAISAGALIALACHRIAVATGATIGAATPVRLDPSGQNGEPASEKTVSYVRKEFRATADARSRPGLLAEAMVDPDVEIEGVVAKGKLLTLTADEALRHHVADFQAEDLQGVLRELGYAGAEVQSAQMNWAEHTVRFLTHPLMASLLMTLALLGIVIELRTPGFGVPGFVGALSLVTFFWGHALVRLVGWEQLVLVGVGIVLLALELFVIPGFGIAGVLGIAALALGLGTSLVGSGASLQAVVVALSRVLTSTAVAALLSLVAFRYLPQLPGGHRLVLGHSLAGAAGERGAGEGSNRPSLLGRLGESLTPLRPAGIASLDGRRIDVVSRGEFIDSGEPIEVIEEGLRVVVRRRQPEASKKEAV
jgi:membrane-bound serine protease (ClpP class)